VSNADQETGGAACPKQEAPVARHRPLLSAAVAFAAGIAAARALSLDLWIPLALGSCCLGGLAVLRRIKCGGVRTALVLVLVAAAGAATEAHHTGAIERRAATALPALLGDSDTLCTITGTVRGEPSGRSVEPLIDTPGIPPHSVSTLRVRADEIRCAERSTRTSGDVAVEVRGKLDGIGHGDRVRVFGWIKPLGVHNPSDRYAASVGVVARMYAASPGAVRLARKGPGSFLRFLYAVKQSFRDQIDEYLPASEGRDAESATVLKAVLLGDREQLDRRLRDAFNKSGTMHILAISGLHVGIVYAAMFWLCRILLARPWPRRAMILAVVVSYAVITGLRPATVRAALMIVLFEFSGALRYYREPINAVAATALIILAAAPQHLFEAGFQLTFVAVLGIILFASRIARLLDREPDELERLVEPDLRPPLRRAARRARRIVAQAIGVCGAATLVVAPLQAYYFNIVTPVSILATALLVPVIFAMISLGFAFLALAWFVPLLAAAAATVLTLVIALFTSVVTLAGAAPFGHVFVAPPPAGWVWLFYGALLVVAARRWLGLRRGRALLVPACALCAYLGWRAMLCPGPELAATFVDVAHGTCAVVTRGRETVVYDCGSGTPFSTYDVGKGPAAARLWMMGVKRIDLLILSHSDADHVNGVLSLIDRFPTGRVVANVGFCEDDIGRALAAEFRRLGIPFEEAGQGDALALPGIGVEILWPPKRLAPWDLGAVNDRSMVALVRSGERSILLTGDIEATGIGGLMATRDDLRAEVLYVPHHGVDEPGLSEFIARVRPAFAVISAAPAERDDAVLGLLRGARTYRTFESGDIILRSSPAGWTAETERGSDAFGR